jgi:hypothetical protein
LNLSKIGDQGVELKLEASAPPAASTEKPAPTVGAKA